jgi:CheY-like chemotaxis protein
MSEKSTKHILVINDTQEILELFSVILHDEMGFEVTMDSYRPRILEDIKEIKPDLIISDHVFGEEKIGWQLLQSLKMDRATADIPLIICSAAIKDLKEIEGHLTARDVGVLYKPFDVEELISLVNKKLQDAADPTLHHDG